MYKAANEKMIKLYMTGQHKGQSRRQQTQDRAVSQHYKGTKVSRVGQVCEDINKNKMAWCLLKKMAAEANNAQKDWLDNTL